MVKEMEQAFEGQDQDETEPATDLSQAPAVAPKQDIENNNDDESADIVSAVGGESENEIQVKEELSNRPAALLERIYPFMLSKDLNIASDLCLFGGCSEDQLEDMLAEYQMIIEVLWY